MTKLLATFVLLFAFVLLARCESDVVTLTTANFAEKTAEGAWLTEFFAPWCGHCKHLAPTWEKLATELKGQYHVGSVDCTVEKGLCSSFGVRGYPTIKFLSEKKVYDYNGARSVEAFTAFAKDGHKSVDGKDLPNLPQPQPEKKEEAKPAPDLTAEVVELNEKNFYSEVKEGVWMVKFYAPWCGHCKNLAPTWDALATRTEGKFKVAKVDCTLHKGVCNDFAIRGYPTLKLLKDGKAYSYSGPRNEAAFVAFVNEGHTSVDPVDIPNKDAEVKQEAKSVEGKKEVVVLTEASFDSKVSSGEWLVEFYAPWCGHCKHLAPTWDELATKAPVNVAKVDCTVEKDLMNRFSIKGFPTIKFIKDGTVYDYKGARTVDAFLSFVKSDYTSAESYPYPKTGKDEL